MTEHPNQLYAVEFTEADQPRLADFSCGNATWSQHVSEWIKGSDVLDSKKRGTKVWLFENRDRDVIGFGSLGTSKWRWPPPDGASTTIALIPMLGLDSRYHGEPADPDWRYSRQIMSHMLAQAKLIATEWTEDPSQRPSWLVLMVHEKNERAIHFYEKCGFLLMAGVRRRNDHLVMTHSIEWEDETLQSDDWDVPGPS